jgi:hypothetical protein
MSQLLGPPGQSKKEPAAALSFVTLIVTFGYELCMYALLGDIASVASHR